jgi:hypothetical protein
MIDDQLQPFHRRQSVGVDPGGGPAQPDRRMGQPANRRNRIRLSLGAAISLYFIGLEIGSGFAARSALFTAAGLAATVAFVGGICWGSVAEGRGRYVSLACSVLPGMAAYGLAAWVLSYLPDQLGQRAR